MKTICRTPLPRITCALAALSMMTMALAQDPARMDEVVRYYAGADRFMGNILVARGGEVLFARSHGSADLEWDIPNTAATRFRLGSLTKQFTAAAVLLLETQRRLEVTDSVRKHFPEAPASWDPITIRHLLTHTSGIADFVAQPDYAQRKLQPTSPAQRLPSLFALPLQFAPGERMSYSNTGYVLLGILIERASGQPYAQFLQQSIFTPLGMHDTGYDHQAPLIPRRAAGYVPTPAGPVNAPYIDMSVPYSAGGLYSTAADLLKWNQSLFGGRLLSAAQLEKMTTPFLGDYAFGLLVPSAGTRRVVFHNGGIEGFNTYLAWYPDSGITVAVLANLNGTVPDEMGPRLGALAHGDAIILPTERKAINVPEELLERYTGTYAVNAELDLTITLEQSRLFCRIGPQPGFALYAESPTRFFGRDVDAQFEFVEEHGTVTHLVLSMDGREITATRETRPEAQAQAQAQARQ